MSTAASTIDQICQFFGGSFDSLSRAYRTPTVAGLGVVKRGWPREDNGFDYFNTMTEGTATGCVMVAQIYEIHDVRAALPGIQGRRKVAYSVRLNFYFLSTAAMDEDVPDAVHALRDLVTAKIRTDPTLGSGGFENTNGLGFQVGEGDTEFVTAIEQGANVDGVTKAYMSIDFEAHAYDVG